MAFKIKADHLEILISYMELHPQFATGRLSVAKAKDKFRKMWQELAANLNGLGFGERPVEKWQKVVIVEYSLYRTIITFLFKDLDRLEGCGTKEMGVR